MRSIFDLLFRRPRRIPAHSPVNQTPAFQWRKLAAGRAEAKELFSTTTSLCIAGVSTGLEATMHGIIYIVGLIVVLLAVLSFFGLR
jgi:hypothetical protein